MRISLFPVIIFGAMLIFSAAVYPQLPETVPTHWNASGEIDGYGPKALAVLIMPVIVLLVTGMFYGLRRIDPRREAYVQFEDSYRRIMNAVVLFLGVVHIATLGISLNWQFSIMQVIGGGVGLLLIVIGREMRYVQPNWSVGIRTPWTLSDPEVWRETHQTGARVLMVAGGITSVTSLLFSPPIAFIMMIVSILGATLAIFYYSYRVYQARHAHS